MAKKLDGDDEEQEHEFHLAPDPEAQEGGAERRREATSVPAHPDSCTAPRPAPAHEPPNSSSRRVALISSSGSPLAQGLARALARQGYRLALCSTAASQKQLMSDDLLVSSQLQLLLLLLFIDHHTNWPLDRVSD